jgi:hypothetical protein
MVKKEKAKVGRNSPCPCGSGKKYKKCCIGKLENEKVNIPFDDYHQPVFARMSHQIGVEFFNLIKFEKANHIKNFFSLLNPPSQFSSIQSIDILKAWKISLEKRIGEIISKHHAYYWLHLYRRIGPEDAFGFEPPSVFLVRETLECAFAKYGAESIGNDLIQGDKISINEIMNGEYEQVLKELGFDTKKIKLGKNKTFIKKFGIEQLLEIYSLEQLASEYVYAAGCLRRAYKGGELIVKDIDSYYVQNDVEGLRLIDSFDERNVKYGGTSTTLGVPIETWNSIDNLNFFMHPRYNVYRVKFREYPIFKPKFEFNGDIAFNFIFGPLDLKEYYYRHSFIKESFSKFFNFPLECFVSCIFSLWRYLLYRLVDTDFSWFYQINQRAYMQFETLDWLVDYVFTVCDKNPFDFKDFNFSKEEIKRFFQSFTRTDENKKNVDLTTRGPRFLVIPISSDKILIDFSSIYSILSSCMHFIGSKEVTKGTMFEDSVEKILPNNFKIWHKRKKLKTYDGVVKEIDLSFLNRNCLFICELKCINRSFDFEIGTKKALKWREKKLQQAIKEVEEKEIFLAKNPIGKNYAIPDYVDAILGVVVTPFVEYVWSTNDYYWLTADIPRICTPEELKMLNDPNVLQSALKQNFVHYVI